MKRKKYKGRSYFIYPEKGKYYYYNGQEFLHRQVWKDNFGIIPQGFYVHHKNGNKVDNRISNLELMDKVKHGQMHFTNRIPITKKCDICKKEFDCKTFRQSNRFCSNNCKSQWRRDNRLDFVKGLCTRCKKEFSFNKYELGKYCSHDCSGKARVGK